ncbi:unnamed protein product [Clavelina lepadiformis]|uniref:Glutathione peroxidase n=1 Tax=Clavelina lepadiformis TaxID=159417 RepID=A0ABP0G563_CLALP
MNALLQQNSHLPVTVLAFPCNQFGLQEPGKNDEIINGIKYVRPGHGYVPDEKIYFFSKTKVNGMNENPLFSNVKESCPPTKDTIGDTNDMYWNPIKSTDLTWNFNKFLLDKQGIPRFRFGSSPNATELLPWILDLVAED